MKTKLIMIMTLLSLFSASASAQRLGGAFLSSSSYLEQFTTANLGSTRLNLGYRTFGERRRARILGLDNEFTRLSQRGFNASIEYGFSFASVGVSYETYGGEARINGADLDLSSSFARIFIQKRIANWFYRFRYTLKLNDGEANFEDNEVVLSPANALDVQLGYALGQTWGAVLAYTPSLVPEITFTEDTGLESDREAVVSSVASLKFFKEFAMSSNFILGFEGGLNSRYRSTSTIAYGAYAAMKFSSFDLTYNFDGETEQQDPAFANTRNSFSHDIALRFNF